MERKTLANGSAPSRLKSTSSGTYRGRLYEFLSYLFTQNPGKDFIQNMGSEEQISKLKEMEAVLGEHEGGKRLRADFAELMEEVRSLQSMNRAETVRLREDYVRLFRGISKKYGPPPPYESVYRSDMLMSEHASEVRAAYREAGLEIQGNEPPDHIGFELAFMGYLCRKEEEQLAHGDSDAADRFALLQKSFLLEHLVTWVPQFCRNIQKYDSPLYRTVASLAINWLEIEERRAHERQSACQ